MTIIVQTPDNHKHHFHDDEIKSAIRLLKDWKKAMKHSSNCFVVNGIPFWRGELVLVALREDPRETDWVLRVLDQACVVDHSEVVAIAYDEKDVKQKKYRWNHIKKQHDNI